MDCREKLCESCGLRCKNRRAGAHQVVKLGDELKPELIKHRGSYCEQHSNNLMEMYCSECEVNICTVCFAVKHRQHECLEIKEVASEFSKQIEGNMQALSSRVASIKKERQAMEATRENFLALVGKTQMSIKQKGEELKRQVDRQVAELVQQVETVKTETEKAFVTHREDVDLVLVAVESFICYSQEVKDKGTPCDITRVAKDLQARASELKRMSSTVGKYQTPGLSFVPADERQVLAKLGGIKALLGDVRIERFEVKERAVDYSETAPAPSALSKPLLGK